MTNTSLPATGTSKRDENHVIPFGTQLLGYNKDQVDAYVQTLSDAYQAAYDECKLAQDKYSGLLAKMKERNEIRGEINNAIRQPIYRLVSTMHVTSIKIAPCARQDFYDAFVKATELDAQVDALMWKR